MSDPSASRPEPQPVERPSRPSYDVAILGGGLAGLTLALQIKRSRPETNVFVADRRTRPAPEATFKVGESSSEIGAHYFREVVGLADHIDSEQVRKFGLRYFFPAGDNRDISRRVEWATPRNPSLYTHQIDRGRFENELLERCLRHGVDVGRGWRAGDVNVGKRGAEHTVNLVSEGDSTAITSRWLVDATGRSGVLKRHFGLEQGNDHVINSAWFRLAGGLDVEEWSDNAEWLGRMPEPGIRRHSTVHLVGEGYWVWLIQLASGPISIGVCADPRVHPFARIKDLDSLLNWFGEHEPQLAATVGKRRDQVLDFLTVEDFSYGCKRVYSPHRWCLTGEAGAFLDPLFSPGSDFIAIGNSWITDLILRDLAGGRISAPAAWRRLRARLFFAAAARGAARGTLAPSRLDVPKILRTMAQDSPVDFYNFLYSVLYSGGMNLYRDQYQFFGNPQVMIAKTVFDLLGYWGIPTNLFMHGGKWTDADFVASLYPDLDRFGRLSIRMEDFFKEWHARDRRNWQGVSVLMTDFQPILDRQNDLVTPLDDETLRSRIKENVDQLFALSVIFFHKAAEGLPEKPGESVPINALAAGLRPERWRKDGLFSETGISLADAREKVPGFAKIFLSAV